MSEPIITNARPDSWVRRRFLRSAGSEHGIIADDGPAPGLYWEPSWWRDHGRHLFGSQHGFERVVEIAVMDVDPAEYGVRRWEAYCHALDARVHARRLLAAAGIVAVYH